MADVVAIIVTNNRLELLKEALGAVLAQSYNLLQVIIVNNGSTDGTKDWLDQQSNITVIHQENSGGSGGFYTGIKAAIQLPAEWIWVMDDDTICQKNSLEKLINKLERLPPNVGFIGSKCLWKDGTPHLMNIPAIKPGFNGRTPFNLFDKENILLIETCSFVSLLINVNAIRQAGLPYKEFFIWGDDQEYTKRITKLGFLGGYCLDSNVLHKTPINYFPDFYNDTVNNIWKHQYGFRNEFFMVKKNRGSLYFAFWLPIKVAYTSFKIFKLRKENHVKFISVILKAAWASIWFNPQIDTAQ